MRLYHQIDANGTIKYKKYKNMIKIPNYKNVIFLENEIKNMLYSKIIMETNKHCSDSIVNSVISKFISRSNVGIEKYGVTLDREDLEFDEWIVHAQEEHMDAILYLEKMKQNYRKCCCNNASKKTV